jgi:3-deoxy-D-manno-octulosonic-acid transferase
LFIFWDLCYFLAFLLSLPVLVYRMITRGKYRAGLAQRFGAVPPREGDRPCLWVHGVSLGEVLAARTLVDGFRKRHPDWDVVLSTTTNTGFAAARKNYPDLTVFYYPIDFSFAVRRSLSRIRPALVALMELELWPNFITLAHGRNIPVVMVNVRLGSRSFRLQRTFRAIVRRVYARVSRLSVQTAEYASRLEGVGVSRAQMAVTGSLKYDTVPREAPRADELRRALGIAPDEKVIVAGSTWAGEEEMLLDAFRRLKADFPKLRLAIVPRHPERFDTVAELIETRGFKVLRRSNAEGMAPDPEAVILGDTMGELVSFYGLATLVFVGKSLVSPGGGQNVMEPAALGKLSIFGPRMENFEETKDLLLGGHAAAEVKTPDELYPVMQQYLKDPRAAEEMGRRAREVIDSARGATERNLNILDETIARKGY